VDSSAFFARAVAFDTAILYIMENGNLIAYGCEGLRIP